MSSNNLSRMSRTPAFKFVLVGVLVFVISIPLAIVWFLLSERQSRANEVQREIAKDWGAEQRISGPYLIVPYLVKVQAGEPGKQIEIERERYAVFLPDHFNVDANATTEIRRRSIYDTTVYQSQIILQGRFPSADVKPLDAEVVSVRWQDAILSLSISDVSGVKNNVELEVDGTRKIAFEPSLGPTANPGIYNQGIHTRLSSVLPVPGEQNLAVQAAFSFKIELSLNGSSSLRFAPVGRETTVALKSNWPHPSFRGFLPLERAISAQGFSASWRIPHLARSVPQAWSGGNNQYSIDRFTSSDFGVNLFVPVDFYNLVDRALKYGFMFIAAAFGGVFVMELVSARRIHAVQYIFVGLSMVTFYVLLLSLSEHVGFTRAYATASIATAAMVSMYVGKALRSVKRGLTMLGVFVVLFGLLYLLLQLEDYALLAGAIAAFVLLTATMFATLRVNWSGEDAQAYPHKG